MTARTALALVLSLGAAPFAAAPVLAQAETASPTAPAESPDAEIRALYEAMRLPGIVDVMAREGAAYGWEIAATLFPAGSIPAAWTEGIDAIYDPARMEEEVLRVLAEELSGEDVGAMLAFFEAEPGASIAELEVAAREALLDEDVEQAAKEAAAVAMADEDPRLELIRRYAEVNDLIETNVAGALNSNFAYVRGLMDGGAVDGEMTEGDVLADVWSQEPQVRSDTTEWVYSFLLMAYAPATDADVEALIAFSETEPGQVLNRAVFASFDGLFEEISHALGLASARYMTTEEL